jgi:SHS family lactate transporter-like MFS transporter
MASALEHLKPPVPLERREVRILALMAIVAFSQGWTGTVITHSLPFMRETFDLSDAAIFDLLATVRAVALFALLLSWWGDRSGRRKPLILALVALAAANLATAFAPTVLAFTALQSMARIGSNAAGALALVMLAEEVNPLIRGYVLGAYALVVSMGTGFGLLVRQIGEMSDEAWRLLFGMSAVPLLAVPIIVLKLQESRAFAHREQRPPLVAALRGGHARYFWPMAAISFALAAFSGPAANLALVRLENELGWSAFTASIMLAATSAPAVTLGLLGGGRAADLIGRKPTEVVSLFVGVAGGLAFYFFEAGWIMATGIFFSMLGAAAFGPAFTSHRAELFPTDVRATAGAWLSNAGIFGGLAGFGAGRFVVDAWGVPITMASLGVLLLFSAAFISLLPETRGAVLTEADPSG